MWTLKKYMRCSGYREGRYRKAGDIILLLIYCFDYLLHALWGVIWSVHCFLTALSPCLMFNSHLYRCLVAKLQYVCLHHWWTYCCLLPPFFKITSEYLTQADCKKTLFNMNIYFNILQWTNNQFTVSALNGYCIMIFTS